MKQKSSWSIVGSANLDFLSLSRNDEGNVGILDEEFGKRMMCVFEEDMESSIEIKEEEWGKKAAVRTDEGEVLCTLEKEAVKSGAPSGFLLKNIDGTTIVQYNVAKYRISIIINVMRI